MRGQMSWSFFQVRDTILNEKAILESASVYFFSPATLFSIQDLKSPTKD